MLISVQGKAALSDSRDTGDVDAQLGAKSATGSLVVT